MGLLFWGYFGLSLNYYSVYSLGYSYDGVCNEGGEVLFKRESSEKSAW
jgi:hypothetical protein